MSGLWSMRHPYHTPWACVACQPCEPRGVGTEGVSWCRSRVGGIQVRDVEDVMADLRQLGWPEVSGGEGLKQSVRVPCVAGAGMIRSNKRKLRARTFVSGHGPSRALPYNERLLTVTCFWKGC
jgi:hypothetical protein